MGTLRDHGLQMADVTFQQDNDPKHTSHQTQEWIATHNLLTLEWPTNRPDLNPMENIWNLLKNKVWFDHKTVAANEEEL